MDDFYEQFYTHEWNTPFPTSDEAARAGKLLPWLSQIAEKEHRPLRLIDVGCGRGWLTSLVSVYGEAVGIEPTAAVVEFAKHMFPHLTFSATTIEQYRADPVFKPFQVVICSEVIEHVPYDQQEAFLNGLKSLLEPCGNLLLTTPRGELFLAWKKSAKRTQPVEDWLTEAQLSDLVKRCGLHIIARDRCFVTNLRSGGTLHHMTNILRGRPMLDWESCIYQLVWLTT